VKGVSLAGEWHTIVVLRYSPVPYGVINYALSGVPSVHFWRHYLPTSVVARVPQNLVELQFGIVMRDLAEYYSGAKPPDTTNTVKLVVTTVASLAAVIGGWYYSKRAWVRILQQVAEEEQAEEEERSSRGAADSQADSGLAGSDEDDSALTEAVEGCAGALGVDTNQPQQKHSSVQQRNPLQEHVHHQGNSW
jgi:hypothetical protein